MWSYLQHDVDHDDEEGEGKVEEEPDLNGRDGCRRRAAAVEIRFGEKKFLITEHLSEMDK